MSLFKPQNNVIQDILDFINKVRKWLSELSTAGSMLIAAGDDARNVGSVVQDGRQIIKEAAASMSNAAAAIEACEELMRQAGDGIDLVRIPVVTPKTDTVLGVTVVTGLSIEEVALFRSVGDSLKSASNALQNTVSQLNQLKFDLGRLDKPLADASSGLNVIGDKLKEGGQELQKIAG